MHWARLREAFTVMPQVHVAREIPVCRLYCFGLTVGWLFIQDMNNRLPTGTSLSSKVAGPDRPIPGHSWETMNEAHFKPTKISQGPERKCNYRGIGNAVHCDHGGELYKETLTLHTDLYCAFSVMLFNRSGRFYCFKTAFIE